MPHFRELVIESWISVFVCRYRRHAAAKASATAQSQTAVRVWPETDSRAIQPIGQLAAMR
jgi:hypothetical protein